MNPPRWDTRKADLVRQELLRRVERDDQSAGGGPGTATRPRQVLRLAVAMVIVLGIVIPASIFALTQAPRLRMVGGGVDPAPTVSVQGEEGLEAGAVLVGLWKVQAAGEGSETWVRFETGSVTVERDRGLIYGSWISGDDRFAADLYGFNGGMKDHTVAWLEGASSFQPSGDEVVLRGPGEEQLATLRPATDAPDPRNALPELMDGHSSRAEVEAFFAPPTPAKDPGPALTVDVLSGRWRTGAKDTDGKRPFLTFAEDGTYRASDGCNGTSGRWLLSSSNRVAFTSGFQTQVACENLTPVPAWMVSARTMMLIDGRLTLFDRDGAALGTFDRH